MLCVALTVAAAGCADEAARSPDEPAVDSPTDEGLDEEPSDEAAAQEEWDARAGTAWEAFTSTWSNGFSDGCAELFAAAPNGTLYNGDQEFVVDDCTSLDPGDPEAFGAVIPDQPSDDGYELGHEAGCGALFDQEGVDELYSGRSAYTAEDCGPSASSGEGGSADEPKKAPTPSGSCGEATYEDYAGDYGGNTWGRYSPDKRRAVACIFVKNNPNDCAGVEPAELAQAVYDGYGSDFPLAEPLRDALLKTCKRLG